MASELMNLAMTPLVLAFQATLIVFFQTINFIKSLIPYKYRAKDVRGKIAFVTGSGSGIGRLTALHLAKLGCHLVLIDVNEQSIKEVEKEITREGGKANAYKCDLCNKDEIYRVCDQVKREIGDVDILVNNAGIVTGKRFLDSSDAAIERTFQVNIMAHFWLAKAFLPRMIEKNSGHLVTIASVAGYFGAAGLGDYCSSKFAAVGFDESLRNELSVLGKDGVITTCVNPYYINTGMFQGVKSEMIPMLEPEYVADKIIEAILTNQRVLMVPRSMYLLNFIKSISPVATEPITANYVFKTNHSMDTFVGRNKQK